MGLLEKLGLTTAAAPTHVPPDTLVLGPNFTLGEFTFSETAVRKGLANVPGPVEVNNLRVLVANVLQPLRNAKGRLLIQSGFRAAAVNRAVGGVRTSYHKHGMAADITSLDGVSLKELGAWVQEHCNWTEMISEYDRWLHVAYDASNLSREIWRYQKIGKKTKRSTYDFLK